GAIIRRTEVIMVTLKHAVAIAIAVAMAIAGASAFGISAVDYSARQPPKRYTPPKSEFRLSDHQRLKKILLGQDGGLPLR
ncbi:MAG TPA: hypothetical protein VH934_21515, partial [Xanthobacteraceae bacterium]